MDWNLVYSIGMLCATGWICYFAGTKTGYIKGYEKREAFEITVRRTTRLPESNK